jgi:hypothetical protein
MNNGGLGGFGGLNPLNGFAGFGQILYNEIDGWKEEEKPKPGEKPKCDAKCEEERKKLERACNRGQVQCAFINPEAYPNYFKYQASANAWQLAARQAATSDTPSGGSVVAALKETRLVLSLGLSATVFNQHGFGPLRLVGSTGEELKGISAGINLTFNPRDMQFSLNLDWTEMTKGYGAYLGGEGKVALQIQFEPLSMSSSKSTAYEVGLGLGPTTIGGGYQESGYSVQFSTGYAKSGFGLGVYGASGTTWNSPIFVTPPIRF